MNPVLPHDSELHFDWRLTHDFDAIHALHRAVIENTPAGMVRPDDLAHFKRHTGECGDTLGCFLDGGSLVAYGVLGVHSPTVSHLADMLDCDPARFCVLDGAATLPEWRGYKLHYEVIDERMLHARRLGRTLVGATVSPDNIRSMRGLFRAGFEVYRYAIVYGGLARLVMRRDLGIERAAWELEMRVPARDHLAHRAALAAGLTGYACRQDEQGAWHIDYGFISA